MEDEQLEMREKYVHAADLLDSAITVICDAYNLKVNAPIHDVAGWMLDAFFIEDEKEGG